MMVGNGHISLDSGEVHTVHRQVKQSYVHLPVFLFQVPERTVVQRDLSEGVKRASRNA
jgi:hypothetical protein